jgi:hypothetical protein
MFFVRTSEGRNPTRALNMGTYAPCVVFALLSFGVVRLPDVNMAVFWASCAGLIVLALFAAYAETVGLTGLDLLNSVVIVGIFLGGGGRSHQRHRRAIHQYADHGDVADRHGVCADHCELCTASGVRMVLKMVTANELFLLERR